MNCNQNGRPIIAKIVSRQCKSCKLKIIYCRATPKIFYLQMKFTCDMILPINQLQLFNQLCTSRDLKSKGWSWISLTTSSSIFSITAAYKFISINIPYSYWNVKLTLGLYSRLNIFLITSSQLKMIRKFIIYTIIST